VNGKVHHFRPFGLLNGLVILIDKETHSLWDHITGRAIDGPLMGYQLDVWPVQMTTVKAVLARYPETKVLISKYPSIQKWLAERLYPRFIHVQVYMPFFFRWTMQDEPDARLPELTQGIGIVLDGKAKYYPLSAIPLNGLEDRWLNRTLNIVCGKIDGSPRAFWRETGTQPMQLLTRWYGFSYTYPGCEIYES
jgi:hypothetical protein